jgi:hypothetical protein
VVKVDDDHMPILSERGLNFDQIIDMLIKTSHKKTMLTLVSGSERPSDLPRMKLAGVNKKTHM